MSDFVHLHVHSHYSLLDGLPKIPDLVKAAKKRGFTSLALTDHGALYGAIEFYECCLAAGIKPIIGLEANVAPVALAAIPGSSYHLVLLAENLAGYRNLLKLVSQSQLEGLNSLGVPVIKEEWLKANRDGLIALSGCAAGELATALKDSARSKLAARIAERYNNIFGAGNFYLEINDLPALPGQTEINAALLRLGQELNLPLVVTRDAHYLSPDDAEAQDVLTCIAAGRTIDEPNRSSLVGVDYSLAPAAEIAERWAHLPEALINTVKIAARASLKLELNRWHFPPIDLPRGTDAGEYLRAEVLRRLPELMAITPEVKARVEYELEIIVNKKYSPYFLVVADYVRYARENGIIETTRGSAAGSLVSYALGITNVNPLYFKLPFERFLTAHRPSPPDVDADFADDRRDEMIAYVTKKYGADKVAQIITFGTMQARAAVRDVGRALGYPYTFCDQVAKLIPFGAQGFQMTIQKALDAEPDLKKLSIENVKVRRLLDLAQRIEGCARHTSMHAAGVVIAPTVLTDFTPIQRETVGGRVVTQYEMHSVEAAGLLKMDFLGIRNLSILGHAVEIIAKTTGQKIDVYHLEPWDDAATYAMLARGETVGVFQLASSGMTRYLKELKPANIFDIMAMVALFRPGPMESIPEYIRRRHHPELIEYLDPRMKEYLDQSLGLIVYQDDVLLTAINLAGYTWEEADKFRKAMGKKIPAEMSKQKEKFFKGCQEHGNISELKIHRLWELIEPFAAYGFGKAHAASYGVVAYQTAYLKANFPIQYMTAVLIAESGDIDKVPAIIHECERMGLAVLPPDVNESFKNFAMVRAGGEDSHIRFGLNGIKNLGEHIADAIYRERKERGLYKNLEDFLRRVPDKDLNKKSLESLIKCGALTSFGHDRGELLANLDTLLAFHHNISAGPSSQQTLFADSSFDVKIKLILKDAPPAPMADKLIWEKELLGLYVSSHPFIEYEKILAGVLTPLSDLPASPRASWVIVGGVISATKKKITRQGQSMLFVTIEDTTGPLDLLVFPRTFETTKDIWQAGSPVCVVGKTGEQDGDDKVFVERAYVLTADNAFTLKAQLDAGSGHSLREYVPASALESLASGVEIALTAEQMKNQAEAIKEILKKYPGDKIVYIKVGDKRIKTQYHIGAVATAQAEIQKILL